jgi:signal transduction histidine kinase
LRATAETAQRIGGKDSVDEHGETQDAGDEQRRCGAAAHDRKSWRRSSRLKNDKKMTFIIDISPEDMTIHADPMHISNAISNIIDNSIKYSGDEVEISNQSLSPGRP